MSKPDGQEMPSGFATMPARIVAEREDRIDRAGRGLRYHMAFLDDRLRMILPNDLIILTARSGVGKTSLALDLAVSSALAEHRVGFFALEAEPLELERRTKFRWLMKKAFDLKLDNRDTMDFTDWMLGHCEDIVGHLEDEANEWFLNHLGSFWSYYKGIGRFDVDEMVREITEISRLVDVIFLDHLHYIDGKDGENDNRSLSRITSTLRNIALGVGKPVLAVAHLRKRQNGEDKTLLPDKDDLHGSSDLPKIATHIVAIAPAPFVDPPKWWLAPTLVSVLKDRRGGEDGLAALTMFDKRSRGYSDKYTLGRITKGGTKWEPLAASDVPRWARCHAQMQMDL